MNRLLRILCGIIDVIIILIPVQFIMIGVFDVSAKQADMLFMLLFAVYGVLFAEYMNGMTPGKYFGKIKVADISGAKPEMMYMGLRELAKSLYFIPYMGVLLAVISILMVMLGNGRALHDYFGNTCVIGVKQKDWEANENG